MAGVRKAYLPGTEATVITKAVPPERGLVIALPTGLTSAIIPNVDNSCVKFLIAGNGVRAVPTQVNKLWNKIKESEREETFLKYMSNFIVSSLMTLDL